jgi:hypothetical protein
MPYVTSIERIAAKRELLLAIEVGLKAKFGAEGLQLLPEIREVEDLEVLRTILRAFETATSLDELRRVWSP